MTDLDAMATAVRVLSAEAVEAAGSGHPGLPLGMADVATVLFAKHLRHDPTDPAWPDRDRFVLSAGHGSALLYTLLHLTGYPDLDRAQLARFRQLGSLTPGHPEAAHPPGVETTTGPLGQGLATAVGMALAERALHARFGSELVDHHTWVLAGDGCLMEGLSQEAIELAGHLGLGRLVVVWDDNGITIDGPTELATSTDQLARFQAAGWRTMAVDGHDLAEVDAALTEAAGPWRTGTPHGGDGADADNRPVLIACATTIGRGAPTLAGTAAVHGAPLGQEELAALKVGLGWDGGLEEPFTVPDQLATAWREAGLRDREEVAAWHQRLAAVAAPTRRAFETALGSTIDTAPLATLGRQLVEEQPYGATRQASQRALAMLTGPAADASGPRLLGGSADLSGSNLTRTADQRAITADDFTGSYLHYGVREHAMAAAMNGVALHGGFVPYGGTFLAFVDYLRPALRLSALMGAHVIYVLTHDSIGLGQDGPTHQPVEQIASLRAMPGIDVYRPADAVETAEAWAAALTTTDRPAVLCLSRQATPAVRFGPETGNRTAAGAYLLVDPGPGRDVTLLATGTEVALACAAADRLATEGIVAAVVSMPCWERFERSPLDHQHQVLGSGPRVAVEAAVRHGWDRWLPPSSAFIGLDDFGASAPADALYQRAGITVEAIVDRARLLVAGATAETDDDPAAQRPTRPQRSP